ncbi:MAG TPA: phosphodiester glycosidase family protein [Thermoanaerobaculia bacterium]|nr:phosphodiester glycosidase family protein [Thermoanaerobaculia bacterium]
MKRLAAILLFATAALAADNRAVYEKEPNGPHGDCAVDWLRIDSGLDYRAIRCLGDRDDLDMHVVRIDAAAWTFDTAVVSGGSTASAVAAQQRAPFSINANFFDAARRPLGTVVRSGEVVNEPRTSSWQSIFLVTNDGKPRIIVPDAWPSYRRKAAMAVQAGPRLVIKGKRADIKNNYAAARCGVCIRRNGELLFFAMPQDRKFSMFEIGRVVRRGEADGGLGCWDAMLFDGGHSVNFHAAGASQRADVTGDPVPVFLFATRRAALPPD